MLTYLTDKCKPGKKGSRERSVATKRLKLFTAETRRTQRKENRQPGITGQTRTWLSVPSVRSIVSLRALDSEANAFSHVRLPILMPFRSPVAGSTMAMQLEARARWEIFSSFWFIHNKSKAGLKKTCEGRKQGAPDEVLPIHPLTHSPLLSNSRQDSAPIPRSSRIVLTLPWHERCHHPPI